jgi:nicotinate-nucleotide pyrophosphorylase
LSRREPLVVKDLRKYRSSIKKITLSSIKKDDEMSLSDDMMKVVVQNGSNLILEDPIDYDVLKELVAIAKRTGSHITVSGNIHYHMITAITSSGGKQITILDRK